jgi:hypothetical protein
MPSENLKRQRYPDVSVPTAEVNGPRGDSWAIVFWGKARWLAREMIYDCNAVDIFKFFLSEMVAAIIVASSL